MSTIQFSVSLIKIAEQLLKLNETHGLYKSSMDLERIEVVRVQLLQQSLESIEKAKQLYQELREKYISIITLEGMIEIKNRIAEKFPPLDAKPPKPYNKFDPYINQLDTARFGILADTLLEHSKINSIKDFIV